MRFQIDPNARISNVSGLLNQRMKPEGWSLINLDNGEFLIIRFDENYQMLEGYHLNRERVINRTGNDDPVETRYDIIDKENGTRFEGVVCDGIPFGFGNVYNEKGNLLYKGMMINWKRVGYGTSYYGFGMKEYEGYWLDNNQYGFGVLFDRDGNTVYRGEWLNGNRIDNHYLGDGSVLYTRVKSLKLCDRCILVDFDVSPFLLVEEIVLGSFCFMNVKEFQVNNLSHLRSLKVGSNSFSKNGRGCDSCGSFQITNCDKLESIDIGSGSFLYYTAIHLQDLASLKSFHIGNRCFSFVYNLCIDGFNMLVELKIGKNCFAILKNNSKQNLSKKVAFSHSLHVLNCSRLESIEIGPNSFCDKTFESNNHLAKPSNEDDDDKIVISFDGDSSLAVKSMVCHWFLSR